MDGEASGVAVLENYYYNSGAFESGWAVMVHGGADNIVRNNVFIDCAFPFMISCRLNTYYKLRFEEMMNRRSRKFRNQYPIYDTASYAHLKRYLKLQYFFEDDDGSTAPEPYTFNIKKNEQEEVINYWIRRTPSTNVFENNLVYHSDLVSFHMGVPLEGV
jgi:hypothetical protein